ncbi:MAG: ABC transporter permease [Leptospiraceae bacterium]|nr:ABC transporter permease [Leptospiraceae bacterium]MDW7976501.1 ABC transporter permease [Leptospiraceae bacterium]
MFFYRNYFLELFIAFRYLRGQSRLSLLHTGTRLSLMFMSLMVFIMVVVLSVFNGFQQEVKRSLWSSGYHITISYVNPNELIDNYQEIIDNIWNNQDYLRNNLRSVFPSIFVNGLLEYQGRFEGKGIRAIPVNIEEAKLGSIKDFPEIIHFDSAFLEKMNRENIAIIGKEMARLYGWQLGDKITVFLPKGGIFARGVQIQRVEFLIGGFFRTGFYEFDLNLIFISLATAQRILQIPNQTTSIIVQLKDLSGIDNYKTLIREVLINPYEYSISTIKDERGNFLAALQLEKTLMMMILGFLILAGIAGIWITSHLLVQSKRKSIGMLRAMGLPTKSILIIFVSHSLFIGFFACLIGGSMGIYASKNLESFIKFIEDLLNHSCKVLFQHCSTIYLIPRNIYYFDHLPVNVDIIFLISISIFTMILSGIAGYFPARMASRVEPVETIRND